MKIQLIQKDFCFQSRNYSFLIPTFDTSNIFSCEFDKDIYMIFGNQRSLQYLAGIMLLAAENKDKIIYLTNMQKNLPEHLHRFSQHTNNNEIVLLHHSLQLNISAWKNLKHKLNKLKGNMKSFIFNPRKFTNLDYNNYKHFNFSENKDKILIRCKYNTLFLIGSKMVFEYASGTFEPLSRTGASYFLKYKGHDHDHLDILTNRNQGLCIDFYDQDLWDKQAVK
ncbi:hypothetical protein [Paenibacillus elgii]|uniref:hypothetical protein n=1 Tax=Paenibacillus elgii TaxID=189691 RepID=UPI000C1CB004|nr:hypothetical protein [Paenibacillus elgii]